MKKLFTLFTFICVLGFAQKSEIDSKIIFKDGRTLNAKIPFRVNLIWTDLIDETTISDKKVSILENGKKIKYHSSEIQSIEFIDLKNKRRFFVHVDDYRETLMEQVYDGKIKWYRNYYRNGFDGSKQKADVLYKDNNRLVLSILQNNRKKLKALTVDKPELESLIDKINYDKLKDEDLLNVLKKYDE